MTFLLVVLVACLAAASASAAVQAGDACLVLALFAPMLLAVLALLVWVAITVLAGKQKKKPTDDVGGEK